jgi:hypothetical protein
MNGAAAVQHVHKQQHTVSHGWRQAVALLVQLQMVPVKCARAVGAAAALQYPLLTA